MSLIPMDQAHISLQLQNDMNQLRTMISWAQQRSYAYSEQLTTTVMNSAGIDATTQNYILAVIADLNRLYLYMTGNVQGVAADMRFDIANVLGVS